MPFCGTTVKAVCEQDPRIRWAFASLMDLGCEFCPTKCPTAVIGRAPLKTDSTGERCGPEPVQRYFAKPRTRGWIKVGLIIVGTASAKSAAMIRNSAPRSVVRKANL